jgi:Fe-coproporphyrin III synthase
VRTAHERPIGGWPGWFGLAASALNLRFAGGHSLRGHPCEKANLSVPSFAVPLSLGRLPVVTLYVTERCNSRCVTCDYWRHGRIDLSLAAVERLRPSLKRLETRLVVLSGGEPLLHPDWARIAELLRSDGLALWLLTSGLALAKHAARATALFDRITVSLDGVDRETYAAIRGLDAFDKVCEGVRAVASKRPVNLRVTLQRANYRQLPQFVATAKTLGARQVSFLAVDVANTHAFGRIAGVESDRALGEEDLRELDRILSSMERDCAQEFQSGFIAENPQKLRRILQYFSAIRGRGAYPAVRCNAPEFSAVVDAKGHAQPCFFIAGPPPTASDLVSQLNSAPMMALRRDIRGNKRAECERCVCSMWRDLARASEPELMA